MHLLTTLLFDLVAIFLQYIHLLFDTIRSRIVSRFVSHIVSRYVSCFVRHEHVLSVALKFSTVQDC